MLHVMFRFSLEYRKHNVCSSNLSRRTITKFLVFLETQMKGQSKRLCEF